MKRGEVFLLVGMCILFFGTSIWVIIASKPTPLIEGGRDYSSYHTHPEGTKALFTLVSDLGYTVRRRHEPLSLLEGIDILFVIGERLYFKRYEIRAILQWVREGGVMVVATPYPSKLFKELGVKVIRSGDEGKCRAKLSQVSLYGIRARHIVLKGKSYFTLQRDDYLVHYERKGLPVVISLPEGKGRVVMVSSPYPFTNEGIREEENGYFIADLLRGESRGLGEIQFDEYRHGYRFERTIIGYLKRRRLHLLIPQSILILSLLLMRKGVRFGQIIPIEREDPPSSTAYPKAIATLYSKADLRAEVLRPIYHDFRHFLASSIKAPVNLGIENLRERIKTHLRGAGEIIPVLEECEGVVMGREGKISKERMLELAKRLSIIREEILHGGKGTL
jgi:hypothetical protein